MSAPVWAVLVAAGVGKRLGGRQPKQYLPLGGRSMLEHSLARLIEEPLIAGVVVVLAASDRRWARLRIKSDKPLFAVPGGAERADSVCAGLHAVIEQAGASAWALVHDAARPCLSAAMLRGFIKTLRDDEVGGLLAIPARDTLKRAGSDGRVAATLDRQAVWQAQTPQMFRAQKLLDAYVKAREAGVSPTDDSAVMEYAGEAPRLVPGRADNFKVTLPEDLMLAELLLNRTAPTRPLPRLRGRAREGAKSGRR